jgi:hypothetical protein
MENTRADVILIEELTDNDSEEDIDDIIHHRDDGTIQIARCPKKGITDIRELVGLVNNYYNIITTPIFQRGTRPIGFIHPITGQVDTETGDFYKIKRVCDLMYNELHYDERRFRNQSWLKMANLYI